MVMTGLWATVECVHWEMIRSGQVCQRKALDRMLRHRVWRSKVSISSVRRPRPHLDILSNHHHRDGILLHPWQPGSRPRCISTNSNKHRTNSVTGVRGLVARSLLTDMYLCIFILGSRHRPRRFTSFYSYQISADSLIMMVDPSIDSYLTVMDRTVRRIRAKLRPRSQLSVRWRNCGLRGKTGS